MNSVLVRDRILIQNSDRVASVLMCGVSYGHNINFVRNMALWPLELEVRTTIKNENQLTYLETGRYNEWIFEVSLQPFHGDARTAVLLCMKKESGVDEVFTTIISDSGYEDKVSLEIVIE